MQCCFLLTGAWRIALQFKWSHKIWWYQSTQPRLKMRCKGWRLTRLFALSWAECMSACAWLGLCHLCVAMCARGWPNVFRFPSNYSQNILYTLNFLLFSNYFSLAPITTHDFHSYMGLIINKFVITCPMLIYMVSNFCKLSKTNHWHFGLNWVTFTLNIPWRCWNFILQ